MNETNNQPIAEAELQELIDIFRTDIATFAIEIFGSELRPIQLEFANAFRDNKRITFRGGTGFGKTHVLAILVWWSLICHDQVQVTIVGPSEDQVTNGVWKELRSLHDRMHPAFKSAYEITATRASRLSSPNDCFAGYRLAPRDNPAVLRGIHKTNNFCFVDEASNVGDEAFDMLQGILDDPNPKLCLISNPARTDGYFWRTFNDAKISPLWKQVHGRAFDNPSFTEERHQEKIAEFGGTESRLYKIMVLGDFPEANADGLIPRSLVDIAIDNEEVVINPDSPYLWGVDPAGDGADSDRSVLVIRNDNYCTDVRTFYGLDPVQLAYKIRDIHQATPKAQRPTVIAVDAIGVGAGCFAALKEFGLPVKSIIVSNKPTRTPEKYNRLRDQLWWECREWFATENCRIPNISELVSELTIPTYHADNGKIKVEDKKSIKKRMQGKSPDLADALCLTFAVSATRYVSKYSWKKPIVYSNLARYE